MTFIQVFPVEQPVPLCVLSIMYTLFPVPSKGAWAGRHWKNSSFWTDFSRAETSAFSPPPCLRDRFFHCKLPQIANAISIPHLDACLVHRGGFVWSLPQKHVKDWVVRGQQRLLTSLIEHKQWLWLYELSMVLDGSALSYKGNNNVAFATVFSLGRQIHWE